MEAPAQCGVSGILEQRAMHCSESHTGGKPAGCRRKTEKWPGVSEKTRQGRPGADHHRVLCGMSSIIGGPSCSPRGVRSTNKPLNKLAMGEGGMWRVFLAALVI